MRAFVREWLAYSERRARESIRTLPSGRLENEGCHDPIMPFLPDGIPIKVGHRHRTRTRASSASTCATTPTASTPGMNLTRVTSTMAAAQAVFACLDSDIPHNAGSFRRLEVKLRENCVVGIPRFPHSCSVATTNMTDMIINLIQSAFAKLGDGYGFSQGNFCNGAGTGVCSGKDWRRDGAPYVNQMFMSAGGMAASATTDGMHGLVNPVSVGLVYRRQHRGQRAALPLPGRQRARAGGFLRRRPQARRAGVGGDLRPAPRPHAGHQHLQRAHHPAPGRARRPALAGGLPGQDRGRWFARSLRDRRLLPTSSPGSKLHAIDNGGGGYGDPLEREPERVLDDVNEERYVSRARAKALYGVVITGSEEDDDLAVDLAATAALRREMSAAG